MRALVALAAGELLLMAGLWAAWPPAAPLAAGGQLVAWALLSEGGTGEGGRR